jgi:hypothetical protein
VKVYSLPPPARFFQYILHQLLFFDGQIPIADGDHKHTGESASSEKPRQSPATSNPNPDQATQAGTSTAALERQESTQSDNETDPGPAAVQPTLQTLPQPVDEPGNFNDLLPEWHMVPNSVDGLMQSSSFDVNAQGYLEQDIGDEPIDFFLRFWPAAQLIKPMIPSWKLHASQENIKVLTELDEPSIIAYIATKLFLGVSGLCDAKHIWEDKVPYIDTRD